MFQAPTQPSNLRVALKFVRPLLCGLALLPVSQAWADPKIGIDIEAVRPFSSEARQKFGSVIPSIGLGYGKVVPKQGGHFGPDVQISRVKKDDNKLGFYGAGIQYRRTFESEIEETDRFVPYYGAGLGVAYGKVKLPNENIDDSKIVPSGALFIGTSVGKRGLVEARVRALPQVGGINFSGISLTVGARF
jgi:hypothetical protein